MNCTILVGRLTKDPEIKYLPTGTAVTSFTVAVDRKNGKDEADFINCVAWQKLAENVANYCKKGRQVAVRGKIQTRNYESSDGRKVYVTEVVCDDVEFMADGKSNGQAAQPSGMLNGAKTIEDEDNPFV